MIYFFHKEEWFHPESKMVDVSHVVVNGPPLTATLIWYVHK